MILSLGPDLFEENIKRDGGIVGAGKRFRLKCKNFISEKSVLEEDEEKKEGMKAVEMAEDNSMNKEEKKTELKNEEKDQEKDERVILMNFGLRKWMGGVRVLKMMKNGGGD